jgi:hypothetical protein
MLGKHGRILADLDRKGQDLGPAPLLVMITSMAVGVAFFAAGTACSLDDRFPILLKQSQRASVAARPPFSS